MTHQAQASDVLVVGAGPVGLFAALSAARLGLKVELLDESPDVPARGHATILHPSSLHLLEALGVSDKLIASGQRLERIGLYVDAKRMTTLVFTSPALAVPQRRLEAVLTDALRAEGVEVRPALQATTVSETESHVRVRVMRWEKVDSQGRGGSDALQPVASTVVETSFVVGADGRNSRVRSALGIDAGELGIAASYGMFELPSREPGSEVALSIAEGLTSSMIPLPEGRARWGFELGSRSTEKLYATDLQALLARRAPWASRTVDRIDWGAVRRFEQRLARSFGKSRVWLVGDAAHGTGPFGAQSMNVGLTEAHRLVHQIAVCLKGEVPLSTLAQRAVESTHEWQRLLGLNVTFRLLPHAPRWLATHARRLLPMLPASGLDLDSLLEQLGLAVG